MRRATSVVPLLLALLASCWLLSCDGTPTPTYTDTPTPGPTPAPTNTEYWVYVEMPIWPVEDTWLDGQAQEQTHGADMSLSVGFKRYRTMLLRFDLDRDLPPGAVVVSATLDLWASGWSGQGALNMGLYVLKRPWTSAEANWNQPRSGEWWSWSGGTGKDDIYPLPFDTATAIDIRDWVRFADGGVDSAIHLWLTHQIENWGFLVQPSQGITDTQTYYFHSSECSDAPLRPRLVVGYYYRVP